MSKVEWQKQTAEPLFPNILWNRPVNKRSAGRLVLVGGHAHAFSGVQNAYQAAKAAGIGQAKVLLPKSLFKVTGALPDCMFVPNTPSGSISKEALPDVLGAINDSNGALLGPDLSHHAETASVVETVLAEAKKPLIIAGDALVVLLHAAHTLENRSQDIIVADMQTLLKLTNALELPVNTQVADGLMRKITFVKMLFKSLQTPLVLLGPDCIVIIKDGISTTSLENYDKNQNNLAYGVLATMHTQNPGKTFEALTTGCFLISKLDSNQSLEPQLQQLFDTFEK